MKKRFILGLLSLGMFIQTSFAQNTAFQLIHTGLHLTPDFESQTIQGVANLTLSSNLDNNNKLVLDAKAFEISEIVSQPELQNYVYDSRKLVLNLKENLGKNDTIRIKISYIAQPNHIEEWEQSEEKGFYFIQKNDFSGNPLYQFWTHGETDANSSWFPTIESPSQKHTQDIYITLDTAFVSLSNGLMVSSNPSGNGKKTDHWKQTLPHAPYLTMIAGGNFKKIIDKDFKPFELSYYVEPDFEEYAKDIFGRTPEMIALYENLLGVKYPWDKYAQIVVRDFVSGGMENTSASVYYKTLLKNRNQLKDQNEDNVIAHELFHQWFGDWVTTRNWSNIVIQEAMANYAEYLWVEHKLDKEEADYLNYTEWLNYISEAGQKQVPLIRNDYVDTEELFDAHTYQKGGRIIHLLRKEVGDENFFKSLNLYLEKNKLGLADLRTLQNAFEETTQTNLSWFFEQWFYSPGHPVVQLEFKTGNNQLAVKIKQSSSNEENPDFKPYILKIPVRIFTTASTIDTTFTINHEINEFSLPFEGGIICPVINANGFFPGEIEIVNFLNYDYKFAFSESNNIYTRLYILNALAETYSEEADNEAKEYEDDGEYLGEADSIDEYNEKDQNTPLFIEALKDPFKGIRDIAVQQLNDYNGKYFLQVEKALENVILNDPDNGIRTSALLAVKDFLNPRHEVFALELLKEDSYKLKAAALEYLFHNNYSKSDSLAEAFKNLNDAEVFASIANYYIAQTEPNQTEWMLNRMMDLESVELYQYMGLLTSYLLSSAEDDIEITLPYYEKIAFHGNSIYERYAAVMGLYTLQWYSDTARDIFKKAIENEKNSTLKEVYKSFND